MNPTQIYSDLISHVTNPAFTERLFDILILCAGVFLVGALLRLIFGKRSIPVRAVSATLAIIVIYFAAFLLQKGPLPPFFLADLPFISYTANAAIITPLLSSEKSLLWVELVDLVILVFLCGLLEDLLPKSKNIFAWIFFKAVCTASAYTAYCAIKHLFALLLPDFILLYAPIILLALLVLFLAVTVFKWLIGLILGVTGGPFVGAVYAFFISSLVGKQLTKSAFTGGIIVLLVNLAEKFDFTQITIGDPAAYTIAPLIGLVCLVWYLLSRVF